MKINFIIQCRMTSVRFPGKVLAPLLGKPVLDYVVAQIKNTKEYSSIILATSDDKADDPLSIYANNLGLEVVRGSCDDVVDRYVSVLDSYNCDAFLGFVVTVLCCYHICLIMLYQFIKKLMI